MRPLSGRELALAIYPLYRGFAFTVFESPLSPVDWGIKEVRGDRKNARSLEAAKHLIERLQPVALVLESAADAQYRRGERIRRLQRLIANYAQGQSLEVYAYTRNDIRECFKAVGAMTRYETAQVIASQIHAFSHRLPPPRKPWKSEDARMGLFNAAALVLTFYGQTGPIVDRVADTAA